jgi:hypothetical protein
LHEGGLRIRRDHEGAIYFERPDGRVIPRQGYRLEDVLDDGLLDDAMSPYARLAAVIHAHKPSAEVRETAAVYRLSTRARSERGSMRA